MTKNNIITNSQIINTLNHNFTTKVTKESQKLSLNSTKVNIKHTKEPSVFNISFKGF
jgi:hypothetical protein